MVQLRKILFLFSLLINCSLYAQQSKYPVLGPYEIGNKGTINYPDSFLCKGLVVLYDSLEITALPKNYPYRTVAYFDSCRLISLHLLFNESEKSFPYNAFELIKNKLVKLWAPYHYPFGMIKHRRGMGIITYIWETADFRVEWIYKNQPNSTTKKMGWLFLYTRDSFIEDY